MTKIQKDEYIFEVDIEKTIALLIMIDRSFSQIAAAAVVQILVTTLFKSQSF